MLEDLVDVCQRLVVATGYPGVVLVAILENFFPPLPSEVIFPFVGFVVGRGELSLLIVILSGVMGTFVGALFWYFAGYVLGANRLKEFISRHGKPLGIKVGDIERAEIWFGKHQTPVVFFGRLIPIIRTFVSIPAGFVKMNILIFSLLTFVGSTLWIGALSYAGFALGGNWEAVVPYLEKYELIVAALAVGAVVFFLIKKVRSRKP
jgi:membrane protein DedA with SNARE-associated domain